MITLTEYEKKIEIFFDKKIKELNSLEWNIISSGRYVLFAYINDYLINELKEIPLDFLKKYYDKINWESFIEKRYRREFLEKKITPYLDEELIKKLFFEKQIATYLIEKIVSVTPLSEEILEFLIKEKDINFDSINANPFLTKDFIIKYAYFLNPSLLLENKLINFKFLKENKRIFFNSNNISFVKDFFNYLHKKTRINNNVFSEIEIKDIRDIVNFLIDQEIVIQEMFYNYSFWDKEQINKILPILKEKKEISYITKLFMDYNVFTEKDYLTNLDYINFYELFISFYNKNEINNGCTINVVNELIEKLTKKYDRNNFYVILKLLDLIYSKNFFSEFNNDKRILNYISDNMVFFAKEAYIGVISVETLFSAFAFSKNPIIYYEKILKFIWEDIQSAYNNKEMMNFIRIQLEDKHLWNKFFSEKKTEFIQKGYPENIANKLIISNIADFIKEISNIDGLKRTANKIKKMIFKNNSVKKKKKIKNIDKER